jgi:hypothetical protein
LDTHRLLSYLILSAFNTHKQFLCEIFLFRNIPAKLSRSAKQHQPNSAHLVRRCMRGLWIYMYRFFIPTVLQAQFPTCATHGAGVVGTSKYQSIPNTTVNVMRPKFKFAPHHSQLPSPIYNVQCLSKPTSCGFLLACFLYTTPVHPA